MLACVLCFSAPPASRSSSASRAPPAAIAGFELLAGIAVAAGFTQWETTLGREIPAQALSRVTSLDWFTTAGAMPLGFAAVAGVAAAIGTRTTMLVSALVVMALCASRLPPATSAAPRREAAILSA